MERGIDTDLADERAQPWGTIRVFRPPYDDCQSATGREIPVVVLERV